MRTERRGERIMEKKRGFIYCAMFVSSFGQQCECELEMKEARKKNMDEEGRWKRSQTVDDGGFVVFVVFVQKTV